MLPSFRWGNGRPILIKKGLIYMADWVKMVLTIAASVFASSGFWAWMQARHEKKDAKTQMILGLGHDRIMFLCTKYLERGWITYVELDDLTKYLYTPYQKMGGNGTAAQLMEAIQKLPIKQPEYEKQ